MNTWISKSRGEKTSQGCWNVPTFGTLQQKDGENDD
jgi:hypothetical protein